MVIAIIPAAGIGSRLGHSAPKALVPLATVPMIVYSAYTLACHPEISTIIVSTPEGLEEHFHQLLRTYIYKNTPNPERAATFFCVAGGKERGDSIKAALTQLSLLYPELADSSSVEVMSIIVHDAARPFTPHEVIDRILYRLNTGSPATIPVLPVVDTIKVVNEYQQVVETLPREKLYRTQTPQGFLSSALYDAYHQCDPTLFTDDASMLESLHIPIDTVPGSELSHKITVPSDIVWAENLLPTLQPYFPFSHINMPQ